VSPASGDPREGAMAGAFEGGRLLRLRPGATILDEGDASNRVVLLLSGRVKVSSFSGNGHETVLGYRDAGTILGELAAIDGEPHSATVTVVEAGEALLVPADRFLDRVTGSPELSLELLRSVVRRLRGSDRRHAEFLALDVVGRVAHRLIELAESHGQPVDDGVLIGIPMTQRELAGLVGSSREAVNKALAQLGAQGLVSTRGRHVVVLDLEGLRARGS